MNNPYAPPLAEYSSTPPVDMPMSVKVAIAVTAVYFLITAASLVLNATSSPSRYWSVGVGGLVLFGMIKGHRLAWQWGRLGGIVAILFGLLTLIGFIGPSKSPNHSQVLVVGISVMMTLAVVMVTALSMPSAKHFFGLICPQCARSTSSSADFMFTKAKCKACKLTW
ncbi:MAG: hypothetical protein NVS3B20_14260 [Polyangiales bacterium]